MQASETASQIIRFGAFELDVGEARLTKSGQWIHLQGQPLQILELLLENAGQVVTREEMRRKLWSDETFVEFDDALNTAVRKLRSALGDKADNPRFLETVPRRGYRFIAPVTLPPRVTAIRPQYETPHPQTIEAPMAKAEATSAEKHEDANILRRHRGIALALVAALVVAALGVYWKIKHKPFQINPKDTIVVADFVNTTGQPVFDDSLRKALEIGLEQSPVVSILPERKATLIMKQMGHAAEERITGTTALEVCQRAGGKAAVQGSIASLGRNYLVGLAAIRCDNGDPIAHVQIEVRREQDVLNALGRVIAQVRPQLGESLPLIERYNAPLEQATTLSLEALNTYSLALTTWDRKGDRSSLPLFIKATELDPNFAQAYGGLATVYHNLGNAELARENATKAYDLRSRVTVSERANIEARYYAYVTGELEKTQEVRATDTHNYPDSAGAWNRLGNADAALGRYAEAAYDLRKALSLDASRANTYAYLAQALLATNDVEGAFAVLAEAQRRSFRTDELMQTAYWIAFLRNDDAAMQKLLSTGGEEPGIQATLLVEQANTLAYHGRFADALQSVGKAAEVLQKEGNNDLAAASLAQMALWEAEFDRPLQARGLLLKASKLSHGQDVTTLAALCLARLGDVKQAERLSLELAKNWPKGTYVQRYWLPMVRAEIDLREGRPSKAVDDLALIGLPLELAAPPALPSATLYAAYLRGEAYIAMGDTARASAEFQKFIDHKTLVVDCPLAVLARFKLATAYSHADDQAKSQEMNQQLRELWKDADFTLPASDRR